MKKLIPYVIYLVTLLPIVFFRNHLYSIAWVSILSLISIYKYFNAIGMKKTIYEYFSYLLLGVAVGMYTQMNIFEYKEIIIIFLLIISILINLIMKKKYTFNQILLSVFGYLYTIMLPLYLLMISYRVKMFYSFILLFVIILLIKLTEYLKNKIGLKQKRK